MFPLPCGGLVLEAGVLLMTEVVFGAASGSFAVCGGGIHLLGCWAQDLGMSDGMFSSSLSLLVSQETWD
jgi:hypothetical protein